MQYGDEWARKSMDGGRAGQNCEGRTKGAVLCRSHVSPQIMQPVSRIASIGHMIRCFWVVGTLRIDGAGRLPTARSPRLSSSIVMREDQILEVCQWKRVFTKKWISKKTSLNCEDVSRERFGGPRSRARVADDDVISGASLQSLLRLCRRLGAFPQAAEQPIVYNVY